MQEPFLDTDERLDEVVGTDLKLIQKIDGTAFAIDTLLLAEFTPLSKEIARVADLGSGSGILAFMLKYRNPALCITGFEIQEDFHLLAKRNLDLNPRLINMDFERIDVREIPSRMLPESFDLVVMNPPYYPKGSGRLPERPGRAAARHELNGTLADFIEAAAYLLPYGAKLAMIIPAERFYEACSLFKQAHFGMKRVRLIIPKEGQPAHLVLIEAERFYNGTHEPVPNLTIHLSDGRFSEELDRLFKTGLTRKAS